MRKIIILLSLFFVLFSFFPSFFEISQRDKLPQERAFTLEHNYLFDYNFYLSRIREGSEGRWMVTEKYYNQPHASSLFQIIYLLFGKIGSVFGLSPDRIYHAARLILGFLFLITIGWYVRSIFAGWWQIVAFLLIITAGSWPILMFVGDGWRFGTYMGWWSVIDSLQRITTIPHILFGQIFLLLFIWQFSETSKSLKNLKLIIWGIAGLAIGIIFPPTLIVVYTVFIILTVLEFSLARCHLARLRLVFIFLSLPSLIYLKLMFRVMPWSALALFDIQHRMPLPYKEYALALGPMLPLGIAGLLMVIFKKEKKLFPVVSWVLAIGILFFIFERVPTQSPLRFTEAAIHIPLGILAAYFFHWLWYVPNNKYKRSLVFVIRFGLGVVLTGIIIMGAGVMLSMILWLTDQVRGRREGTWLVPIGAQILYPLRDFMDGVYFLRDNTNRNTVVLSYVTAGNYIPAYAGNFVYLGHANTPDEDGKEKIAANFFSGRMGQDEAREFLQRERISYIYFGPQERELGGVQDLQAVYPFITSLYQNKHVIIYRVVPF